MAISDCLNFGSPEDPAVMWQFAEACRGLKDACVELGIPVTGGNVSLYNQTGETAILPTPVVAVLGVIEDVTRRTPTGFQAAGDQVLLLGETREELSGSEWAHVVHGHLGGTPPTVDLAAERALSELLVEATGVLSSAHDVSDGGLAQTLGRVVPPQRRRGQGRARRGRRRGRLRRPVQRVGRPGAGHGRAGRRGAALRAGRRPRRTDHLARGDPRRPARRWPASSTYRSRSCAPPGPRPCPLRWPERRDQGPMRSQHIRALTGVRFFAALWVVVYHSTRHNFRSSTSTTTTLSSRCLPVVIGGSARSRPVLHPLGVRAGPELHGPAGHSGPLGATLRFLWLRLARIWPLYMLVIVGAGVLRVVRHELWQSAPVDQLTWPMLLKQALMVQQWFPPDHGEMSWVGPAWSLSAEWLAYLVVPDHRPGRRADAIAGCGPAPCSCCPASS